MNKKLTEMSMILLIGTSPLCFEYLKQNISSTGIIDKLQSDLNKYSQIQSNAFLRKTYDVKQLIESKEQNKINPKFDLRIATIKLWKSTSFQKYINEVAIVVGSHALGGLLFHTPFFLSIVGYFVLYQVNFMNDFYILQGKGVMIDNSKFSFEKINQLYMYVGVTGLALAGASKAITKFTNNAAKDMFK